MGEILIGTASWTDKTLIESGRFYPRMTTSAEARLRYYATQFSLVEIDSTDYALPAERTAELWAELVRLHGRNAETWAKKGLASAAERFDYLYTGRELEALAPPVKALAASARRVHVLFNNCHGDKAQRNAVQFRDLLLAMRARADRAPAS